MNALPQEVQAVVTKLTQPMPDTEKELAHKLKAQVGDLKTVSIRKTNSNLVWTKSNHSMLPCFKTCRTVDGRTKQA